MATSIDTPPGGFPKSIHGYSVGAVDDYVRKVNSRIESLLANVQTESSRADESKRVLEQMTSELEFLRRRLAETEKRAAEAEDARKRSDEQYAVLEAELETERDRARALLDEALSGVREQQAARLAKPREDTEAVIAEVRRASAEQLTEAHRQLEERQHEIEQLRQELEMLRGQGTDAHHTEGPQSGLQLSAEPQRLRLETEMDALRDYARTQVELVVAEARRNAVQAAALAAAGYREQEERVRALDAECQALVERVSQVLETQSMKAGASTAPSTGGRDESDEKRQRDWRGRDWRSNSDWRSAS